MIRSIPFKKLISKNQPFFIYDEKKLIANIKSVKKIMSGILSTDVSMAFSLKTQPNYKIIETIKNQNLSLDVSSLNELNYALSLGFEPDRVFLGGVGLTDHSIRHALEAGIACIHLNNADVFKAAQSLKTSMNSPTRLTVRFHPDYLMGNKLGEVKEVVIAKFKDTHTLDGLHVYVGRESFEEKTVQRLFTDIQELVENKVFQKEWTLYFGPGLPDLEQSDLKLFKINHKIENIKIEVGRSITSSCGYYGAPVLSVKQFNSDKKTVIIDGGLQHFGSPWVNLRQGPIPMRGIFCDSKGKIKNHSQAPAAIYGSLCLWHDCLHPSFSVPTDIKRGDWILVPHMGAYGLTAGVPLFIGETLPLEFYFDGKQYLDVTHHNFGKIPEE